MKIVQPSHEIMLSKDPLKHIERIGRICYKSEDAITNASAQQFVSKLFKSGHHAMLEHFRFIIELHSYDYHILASFVGNNKYIAFTNDEDRYIISASARGINDMFVSLHNNKDVDAVSATMILEDVVNIIINHYGHGCSVMFSDDINKVFDTTRECNMRIIDDFNELTEKEYNIHAWYSILFTCDRGVTHEMVRHRDASFAQESTRYCNYSTGKYGSEITAIDPFFFDKDEEREFIDGCDWAVNKYDIWETCIENLEKAYMMLIKLGATPQQARSILPNSTKSEIVITAQVYEWRHIFDLRVLGKTGTPHPQIKQVMEPAFVEMLGMGYL